MRGGRLADISALKISHKFQVPHIEILLKRRYSGYRYKCKPRFMNSKLMMEIFNNLYQMGLISSDEYNILMEMLMEGSGDDV